MEIYLTAGFGRGKIGTTVANLIDKIVSYSPKFKASVMVFCLAVAEVFFK